MKKYLALLFLLPAICQAAFGCIVGYRVESAATANATVWSVEGSLPANATSLVLHPPTTRFYHVVLLMSDGMNVTSSVIPITVNGKPNPPINLKNLFVGRNPLL